MSTPKKSARPAKRFGSKTRRIWASAIAAAVAIGTVGFGANYAFADDAVRGVDVSGHQGSVDWGKVTDAGYSFAFVKATEGNDFTSDTFAQQYNGSYKAGMVRGAYHFALPNKSSGTDQANYFLKHGGGWSADDHTLPGTLDIEWNPYGDTCYGLSKDSMVSWISDFAKTYKGKTGRDPIIYTAASWWDQCTGGSGAFSKNSPLWVAQYADSPTIPGGFGAYSFWQHTSTASVPGVSGDTDANVWNGDKAGLTKMANGK